MADIKTKGPTEKPKVKTSGVIPKEATAIIKEKYQEQQEHNAPGQKDPVRYATDKVESGGKRAARTAGDAIKQKAKKEFAQQRRKKTAQNQKDTSEPPEARDPQAPNSPGETPEPTTQSAAKTKVNRAEQCNVSTRDRAQLTESRRLDAPYSGKRAISETGGQRKLPRNNAQIPMGQSGLKFSDPKSGSKAARSLKADGNRPKFGTALQKRMSPFQRSKAIQRQLSLAQKAKALARRRAQKEMVKKAGQRTKQVATKAGKATMRFAQAVGRVALAAVKGVLAAGGGVILLIMLLCLILVAAIAASPFGIFFAGGGSQDGVPVSVAVAQVNYAYNETLEELQTAESYDDIVVEGTGADWVDVLAVFAVKVAGRNDTDATDVVTLDENRIDRLETVFWDMNDIAHEVEEIDHPESSEEADGGYTERILHITITGKTAEEMAMEYGFTDQQLEMLQELLEERETLADLIGSLMNVTADAKEVLLNLPEDLSPEREAVIRAACSLVGKVNYFWGGKSLVLGWDSRWGRLTEVTAAGNSTTGTYRPYGLDCSGFVDWVFYNATDGEYIIGHGGGSIAQHRYCADISWSEAQIGDLVFYPEDTHVGIVCGWDESGNILIAHCAFSANNVVITGQEGFTTIGRPVFYGGTSR